MTPTDYAIFYALVAFIFSMLVRVKHEDRTEVPPSILWTARIIVGLGWPVVLTAILINRFLRTMKRPARG